MEFTEQLAIELLESTVDYPISLEDSVVWLGYSRKDTLKDKLVKHFEENVDYIVAPAITGGLDIQGSQPANKEYIYVTVECFKQLGMLAGTEKGKEIRLYFIKCEKELKKKLPGNYKDALKALWMAEEEKEKLVGANQQLKVNNGELKYENGKLTETVKKVSEFKNFKYFFDLTVNTLTDDYYANGVTAYQFIEDWNAHPNNEKEQIDDSDKATIARRASSFYRSVEGVTPPKTNKYQRILYSGKKVAYIIATIKLVLEGI